MTDHPNHGEHPVRRPVGRPPMNKPQSRPPFTEAEIERSQSLIAAVLGPEEMGKIEAEAKPLEAPAKTFTGGGVATGHTVVLTPDKLKEMSITPTEAPSPAWNPMDTAKHDGRPVWVTDGNGKMVEAVWRSTRRVVLHGHGGAWKEYGFWAVYNGGGQAVPFEPRGWFPITGVPG